MPDAPDPAADAPASSTDTPASSTDASDPASEDAPDPALDDPHAALRDDEYLGPVVREVGILELDASADPFDRLITSVLRQQVSMASAAATRERLVDAVDVTPASILNVDDAVLRDAGLSRQKTRYVNEIAAAFRENDWDRETFEAMDDEEVRRELTAITGVGDWTADMFLLFVLGREDVFPVGDLGIRKGTEALFDREMTRAEMVEASERWAPYRSYASLYIWQAYEG